MRVPPAEHADGRVRKPIALDHAYPLMQQLLLV